MKKVTSGGERAIGVEHPEAHLDFGVGGRAEESGERVPRHSTVRGQTVEVCRIHDVERTAS